jgi:TonB family protein
MQFLDKMKTSLLRASDSAMAFCQIASVFLLILGLPGMAPALPRTLSTGVEAGQTPGQAPAQTDTPAGQPVRGPAAAAPESASATAPGPALDESILGKFSGSEITEDELHRALVGKELLLRGAYLGDSLSFSEHGNPTGHPGKGSFTLSGVKIDRVKLTKHKLELEGARYGLHYVVGLPDVDPNKEVDWVRITPKKKALRITIDREQVAKQKPVKEKAAKGKKGRMPVKSTETTGVEPGATTVAPVGTASTEPAPASDKAPDNPAEQAAEQPTEKESEQAADPKSVTTTTKPAHASSMLRAAIDKVLAAQVDARMATQLPEFWRLYFQAKAAGVEYRPHDATVLRSTAVDQQAKVVSAISPESNEIAQANGISGRALYRAVIGADGAPTEIAVVRPIGFGLDEKAVEAIQKAKFQPAAKGGQAVAEALDLAVVFRIYSKKTAERVSEPQTGTPIKPGPYSAEKPPQ